MHNRFFIFLAFLLFTFSVKAYSILTHQALVDAAWDKSIKPFLLKRFPETNSDSLLKIAKSYSYGGAIMPDMGYFPFGNKFYTDLLHYVRSGEFVNNMIIEAKDANEMAFALGVLAHYSGDIKGHSIGINPSVADLYPDMKEEFGDTVTYEENRNAHKRTEFSFDVLQVSKGNYASQDYHQFIGFNIDKDLLERVFQKTYGLKLTDVFPHFNFALEMFRWEVKSVFPAITKASWRMRKGDLEKEGKSTRKRDNVYHFHKKEAQVEYGKGYEHKSPGIGFLAFFLKIMPKVGPLKPFRYKLPTPETEKLFEKSFEASYQFLLSNIDKIDHGTGPGQMMDLDTGEHSHYGEYCLSDVAALKLIKKLRKNNYKDLTPEIRKDLIEYLSNSSNGEDLQWLITELNSVKN